MELLDTGSALGDVRLDVGRDIWPTRREAVTGYTLCDTLVTIVQLLENLRL